MKIPKLALFAALAAAPAQADVTFESVAVDLSNISPSASVAAASTTSDNLWRQRDGFGETAATILELWAGEDSVMTLSPDGLTPGSTYDISANYIRFGASGLDPDGDRGGIRASLDGVNYTLFNAAGGTAGSVGYSELTGHSEGTDRVGLRGYLGTAVANGAGEILVYANAGAGVEERVWFDGVSYELNTTAPPDETKPSLLSTNPADNAVNVLTSQDLVATFDEVIALGATGTVTIKNLTNPADTVISLPGPDPDGTLSVSGTQLTITPATALAAGDEYSIEISPTAIEDLSGNTYDGLLSSDDPNWSFTTDGTAPMIVGMSPMGADANPGSNLTLSFEEDVLAGTGDITIHLASDDSVVASIDVNSGIVSITGGDVVIDPPGDLAFGTTYYVNLPGGAFADLSGNPSDAIDDDTTWRFTTAELDPDLLFADTFNRPDNTDLNASVSGKSGSLGNLDWIEVKSGGEPTITGNTLRLGDSRFSGEWSIAYLDHNFIDPSIAAAGEFTVSVDLGATTSGGGTRFTGFAVGHSLAEVNGWSTNLPTNFTSDFFIGYDPTGTTEVKIFRAGLETFQQTVDLSGGATLSVRFSGISKFNSGSTVNYEAFIDGSSVANGSFFWSGTDENYIALYSNYTTMNGILDNFEVRTASGTPPADPFTTWADSGTLPGTVTFEGDLNGDGVQDGLAFLLGVANPDDDATGALPAISEDGSGGLVLTFDCLAVADRGVAELRVAHSSTLAGWTATTDVVPDADGTDAGGVVSYVVDTVSVAPLHRITATIDASVASNGKLFGRIEGTE